MVWNPFTIDTDGSGVKTVAPTMFLTYGVKHLKIWTLAKDEVGGGDSEGGGGRVEGTEGPAAPGGRWWRDCCQWGDGGGRGCRQWEGR